MRKVLASGKKSRADPACRFHPRHARGQGGGRHPAQMLCTAAFARPPARPTSCSATSCDGPRGRIYLVKQMLEGAPPTAKTQLHLDRLPELPLLRDHLPIGRPVRAPCRYRPRHHRGESWTQRLGPHAARNAGCRDSECRAVFVLAGTGTRVQAVSSCRFLRGKIPEKSPAGVWPASRHARKMLVLAGCVQPAIAPRINAAAARVLDRQGISLSEVPGAGCCGAVRFTPERPGRPA